MSSSTSSSVSPIAELQSVMQNVDLQPLAGPSQGYTMPYPPGLNDPARRVDFELEFIEFTRLVDLHHKFSYAVNNITFPADCEAENQATTGTIERAKKQAISKFAFHVWNQNYQYNFAVGGGGAVKKTTSFKAWAAARIPILRAALMGYSK